MPPAKSHAGLSPNKFGQIGIALTGASPAANECAEQ